MDEANGSLQSAVIIPAPNEQALEPSEQTLKRKLTCDSEFEAKKPRLETNKKLDESSSPVKESGRDHLATAEQDSLQEAPSTEARRESALDDERKRSKRLFGGLLGTLAQSSTTSAQKRRIEIDQKQQAKLRAQDEEREEDKKRRLEELTASRLAVQKKWENQIMETLHLTRLAKSQMLCTTATPSLYYLPYELRQQERDQVHAQIKEAEAENEQQLRKFEASKSPLHVIADLEANTPNNITQEKTELENDKINEETSKSTDNLETDNNRKDSEEKTNIDSPGSVSSPSKVESLSKEKAEESEDVLVEAGEDSLIY